MKQARVGQLLEYLPEATVTISSDQCIVHVNHAAAVMFGYTPEELAGQALDILLPEEVRVRHRLHVERFAANNALGRYMGERGEIVGRRKDGSRFPAEASIVRSELDDPGVVTAIIRDISARKRRDAELAASEERHRAILETCPDAILIGDPENGLILEANDEAGRLFGCPANDLVGVHQSELHPAATRERFRRTFREHMETGRIFVHDAVIQRADGGETPVEIAARPRSIGGKVVLVGFFRDITRQKERERELRHAQENAESANRAKTMFLANMNHELRTPLNGIIGLSEMMVSQIYGPLGHAKYVEYADDISRTGKHLLGVIQGILELSAIELGKHRLSEEVLHVAEVFDECRRMTLAAARHSDAELEVAAAPELLLSADRQLLRQMLINLLSNAVKHVARNGRIELSAEVDERGWMRIDVTDDGAGIAPELLPLVTEPFSAIDDVYARKQGGVGLGLALTKAFVERHDGRLEIESEVGQGTRARLLFPPERVVAAV